MRLWSIHPEYLDTKGLVALWREALLAQKVLCGKTKGYKNHSQLIRFRQQQDVVSAIGCYLKYVYKEAKSRGYAFKKEKILSAHKKVPLIQVARGQILFEFNHLLKKVEKRSALKLRLKGKIKPHPLFRIKPGGIESWERGRFP